jgi:SAM-dependent methyltransferase
VHGPNAINQWYDDHAQEFADADVIELPFVGKSREWQDRLNRFKLWAIDHEGHVDLNGKHVLEFGAGHGRTALAYPGVASYLGVDYSRNLVELGNKRLERAGLGDRAKLVVGDVGSFDTSERFDVVCSLGMMCYFPDPAPVIAAMARFLKPGGSLFFDFRNDSPIYSQVRRVKWIFSAPTGGTTYLASARRVVDAMAGQGLTDVRVIGREFPLIATRYADSGAPWLLSLRNRLATSGLAPYFATESWVFARRAPA